MKIDELGFGQTASVVSVTELQRQFPHMPPKVLVTLAVMQLLSRTVTPFKLCECGCAEPVHGKARLASPACRKRCQRERDALRAGAPKQFNIVLQAEIPVTIPALPVKPGIKFRVEWFHDAMNEWVVECSCATEAEAEAEAKRRSHCHSYAPCRVVVQPADYCAPRMHCDNCHRPTYPDWSRCIHCAYHFCHACGHDHGCGVKFKSAEQVEREATPASHTSQSHQPELI